jgi:hypothetical protein
MDQKPKVFLAERCRCQSGEACFHRRPLTVLKKFETTGRLLVDNGQYVQAVDPTQVTGAKP